MTSAFTRFCDEMRQNAMMSQSFKDHLIVLVGNVADESFRVGMAKALEDSLRRTETLGKEIVFFVSDGDAMCLDCYDISIKSRRVGYRPVFANGEGDDYRASYRALICECGIEHKFRRD